MSESEKLNNSPSEKGNSAYGDLIIHGHRGAARLQNLQKIRPDYIPVRYHLLREAGAGSVLRTGPTKITEDL